MGKKEKVRHAKYKVAPSKNLSSVISFCEKCKETTSSRFKEDLIEPFMICARVFLHTVKRKVFKGALSTTSFAREVICYNECT